MVVSLNKFDLKMESAHSSETQLSFYHTARRLIRDDSTLQTHRRMNTEYYTA
jgi:hypothetical protein